MPGAGERVAVRVVDLVAVAVALVDARGAVQFTRERALRELGRVHAQAHRAAQVAAGDDLDLLGHGGDHRVGRVGIELGGGRVVDAGDVPGVLDHHALQAQAQAEGGDALLAGELQRAELALDAADAEPAGDDDPVEAAQGLGRTLGRLAQVGRDPGDRDVGLVREAAGLERLGDREVGIRQVDVLADETDRHFVLRVVDGLEHPLPARPVDIGSLASPSVRTMYSSRPCSCSIVGMS